MGEVRIENPTKTIKIEDLPEDIWKEGIWIKVDEYGKFLVVSNNWEIFDEIRIFNPNKVKGENSIIKVYVPYASACKLVRFNDEKILVCDSEEKIKSSVGNLVRDKLWSD